MHSQLSVWWWSTNVGFIVCSHPLMWKICCEWYVYRIELQSSSWRSHLSVSCGMVLMVWSLPCKKIEFTISGSFFSSASTVYLLVRHTALIDLFKYVHQSTFGSLKGVCGSSPCNHIYISSTCKTQFRSPKSFSLTSQYAVTICMPLKLYWICA